MSIKPLLAAGTVAAVVGVAAAHAPWPAADAGQSTVHADTQVQAPPSPQPNALAPTPVPTSVPVPTSWQAAAPSSSIARVSNVSVSCEPDQRAVFSQTMVNGEARVNVTCVGTPAVAAQAAAPAVPAAAFAPALGNSVGSVGGQPVIYPAAYVTPEVRTSAISTVSSTPDTHVVHRRAKKSSWQKQALVLGGSAGTGAGIGALIGGGKGALIGAAIGAGGAALYESQK